MSAIIIFQQHLYAQVNVAIDVISGGNISGSNSLFKVSGTAGEPVTGKVNNATYLALLGFPEQLAPKMLNQPPVADAGQDTAVECSGEETQVKLDGSASYDPDGNPLSYMWTGPFGTASVVSPTVKLSFGENIIVLIVNDGTVDSEPDTVIVNVVDTTPPELKVTVSPENLLPPNHKMVEITASIELNDICDPSPVVQLISISVNESDNGKGDGNTTNDIQDAEYGTDDREFLLRAERSGKGEGRIYTIVYSADDFSGNSISDTVFVKVNHDKGGGKLKKIAVLNLPDSYELSQNYPNPFNPETEIRCQLPEASQVSLKIYNVYGQEIKTLINTYHSAGYYSIKWDGTNNQGMIVASGIYIYIIQTGSFVDVKKMTFLK